MRNNAFFNPKDLSLSFLPASKNLLFKLLGGKINRSGFDPSVVIHEASHYFFHHLFPHPINNEIGGLNEGFADYVANIFLENPKVGLVMLQGKILRDSSSFLDSKGKMKAYEPGLEVHDLGERVSLVLWKTREIADDKSEFDRAVVESILELSQDPYSTVHHFKNLMKKRLPALFSAQNLKLAETRFELIFPGGPTVIDNHHFLTTPARSDSFLGFSVRQDVPKMLAEEMGVPASESYDFSIIKIEKISSTQTAILAATEDEVSTTPYWFVLDGIRGNILGIYGLDQRLVKDNDELQRIENLITKVRSAATFIKDFIRKLENFKELSEGKGDLSVAYKISKRAELPVNLELNGEIKTALQIHLKLKRKLLTRILGVPDIKGISLYTVNLPEGGKLLPQINSQTVIGYRIELSNGTLMEVILNKLK